MASALGPEGQAAIAGAEALFSQHAFNAFGAAHSSLIGAMTRDRPYGSVTPGDRTKLAWERTSTRDQARFADDFLSSWLGSDSEPLAMTTRQAGAAALPPLEAPVA